MTTTPTLIGAEPRLAAHLERLGERAHEPLGDAQALRLVGDLVAQDGELVSAEAGDHVAGAQHRAQARPDLAQELVARVVPERVVEHLQVVDVDEERAIWRPSPSARRTASVQALEQQRRGWGAR